MPSTTSTPRNTSRKRKRLLLLASLPALLGLGAAASIAGRIWAYDTEFDGQAVDVAVVLGAATRKDGPSPVFAARLDYAAELVNTGKARAVIVTGGVGKGKSVSEGDTGRSYLLEKKKLAPQSVIAEIKSRTTDQNLCGALQLGSSLGFQHYALVSDPLHLKRAMRLAEATGMQAVPAGTPYSRYRGTLAQLRFLARETYFYTKSLLVGTHACKPAGQA